MALQDAGIFFTHKVAKKDNKDKASGMLPFNRFLARDLYVKRRKEEKKVYSVHMDLATNNITKYKKIGNLEMITKTYKLVRVGGKVNGMAPPIWLLLRSLHNVK